MTRAHCGWGDGFRVTNRRAGSRGLSIFVHVATELEMVEVPGGTFAMGLSARDEEELAPLASPRTLARLKRECRPVHRVTVPTFLCALEPTADDVDNDAAAEIVSASGLRLLAEAEFELIGRRSSARGSFINDCDRALSILFADDPWTNPDTWLRPADESGPLPDVLLDVRQGFSGLTLGEWVADRFHLSYSRAPRDGSAWGARRRPEVVRAGAGSHYPWQQPSEVVDGHAAFRARAPRGARAAVRLAWSRPR